MDYDPLNETPKIRFDATDWFVLVICLLALAYLGFQLVRGILSIG